MTKPNEQSLEPLAPREGISLYLQDREREVSDATLQAHGYRLERFAEYCDEHDIENLNNVTGRTIQRYKIWRAEDVNTVTLKSQLDTLRVFLRFTESVDAVMNGVADSVQSPSLSYDENRSDDIVPSEKADEILAYYSKYEYATIHHALFRLLWGRGCRMGAARSIDLEDLHLTAQYVELHHRPEEDTPLKNGERGERNIALTTKTCLILDDYIETHRHDVTDDYGRNPLFTTEYGRITKNTLRGYIYRMTRPCDYGMDCPHDRDPDTCEAVASRMAASKCPDSTAPHSIRRGAITHFLQEDVPAKVVSDRMNVGEDVIEEHYDERTDRQKMEQRRDFLNEI